MADVHVLGHEIDAHSCLNAFSITPEPSSNLSWMNRVSMEVLPVDCSPRNTTLTLVFTWAKEDSDFFSCI